MTFTVILFAFGGVIILLFNIAINNYLSTRQNPVNPPVVEQQKDIAEKIQQPPPIKDDKDALRAKYSQNLENIKRESFYGLIVLAFLSLGIGYYLSGRFLNPLNNLNLRIEKLKSDNLGSQMPNIPNNEIGKTISYFNDMSLRLQEAFDQQARFVQDASHELRTPLTILRTNLETVLDDKKATIGDLRDSMNCALEEIDSATNLANDLLVLSKPESKSRKEENLVVLVNEVVSALSGVAKREKLVIDFQHSDEIITAKLNKPEISIAVKNLIDNAIKYSAATKSGKISVSVVKKNDHAEIKVTDNGIGIPKAEVGKIFDRFYRVDKSRDRETGGFGLGLAITKKFVEDHNGDISVKSDNKGTVFTVKLPNANFTNISPSKG